MMKRLILSSLLALLVFGLAFAGETGKIRGKVIDKETKEPLPGVNVVVVGTAFGAATDLKGEYVIVNVPVGVYDVRASFVGYRAMTVKGVRVLPDFTTEVNFELSSEAIQVEEVVVTAERRLIQKDATSTVTAVTAQEIQSIPVNSYQEVMTLAPGVVVANNGGLGGGDNGIHVRGGRTSEVSYVVDGIRVDDLLYGGSALDVSRLGIASVSILSGTFNAEYGQAQSAVVNIVTQEGGSKFTGGIRVGTDQFGKLGWKDNDWGTFRGELSLSGPVIPGSDFATFFVSGDRSFTRTYLNRFTGPTYKTPGGRVVQNTFENLGFFDSRLRGNAKLTFKFFENLKLRLGYAITDRKNKGYDHYFKYQYLMKMRDPNLPEFQATNYRTSTLYTAHLTHALSGNTYYEVKFSQFNTRYKYYVYEEELKGDFSRIFSAVSGNNLFDSTSNYEFGGPYRVTLWLKDALKVGFPLYRDYVINGDTIKKGTYLTPQLIERFRQAGYTQVDLMAISMDDYVQQYFVLTNTLSASFASQVDRYNFVKLGFEYKQYDLNDWWINGVNNYWDHLDTLQPEETRHYETAYYRFRPVQAAAYIQDKIEIADLIINVGIRFDYLNPKAPDVYKVIDLKATDPNADISKVGNVKPKWHISPRLGFSHPISDRAKIHFAYGQFYQYPDMFFLYRRFNQNNPNYPYPNLAQGYEPRIGNPNLKPETTHAYEVGADVVLSEDIVMSITAFYKDTYDYISTKRFFRDPYTYTQIVNLDYANSRGIEFALRKRLSNHYAFQINYTYSRAEGNADNWATHFWEAYTASVTGYVPPKRTTTLAWDQPHTLSFIFNLVYDTWGLNFIGNFGSGLPYTPTDARGTYLTGEINSGRMPWTGNIDVRAYKTFKLGFVNATLWADITNLLNKKNVLNVFDDSGRPDYSTNPAISPENRHRPHWYSAPRHVEVGIELNF
jgi:outer membrane receptor protein involved in Fe transport